MTETTSPGERLTALTAQVTAAYLGHNNVPIADVAQVMTAIYQSLCRLGQNGTSERPEPAVAPRKSVFPDYIICLEDGKKLKMLKRHLKTSYDMTPEAYRERWGLSPDYPMVAPNYARQRSRLAKEIGLGTRARRSRT